MTKSKTRKDEAPPVSFTQKSCQVHSADGDLLGEVVLNDLDLPIGTDAGFRPSECGAEWVYSAAELEAIAEKIREIGQVGND